MTCKSFVVGSVLAVIALLLVSSVCFSAEAAAAPASSSVASNDALWNWEIRKERPRIYLDDARLAWLRKKVEGKSVAEVKALAGPSAEGLALAYAITGDKASGRAAIERAMPITQGTRFVQGMTLGIVYDWCYPLLSDAEKATVRKWMTGGNDQADGYAPVMALLPQQLLLGRPGARDVLHRPGARGPACRRGARVT